MGIFGNRNNGTDGLPPLGDDEGRERHEQRRCHTIGCAREREEGLPFCLHCWQQRIRLMLADGDAALQAWPVRPMTPITAHETPAMPPLPTRPERVERIEREAPADLDETTQKQEAELIRALAAPLFERQALDRRCLWCCHLLNEFVSDPRALVHPTKLNYACASHAYRLRALRDVERKMERMRLINQQSTAQIAVYFRYGYLGDYLNRDHR